MSQSLFVVMGIDKAEVLTIREQLRPSHRLYLREHGLNVEVVLGGPTVESEGDTMNGTLLVIRARSEGDVRQFLSGDPYVKAEIFSELIVRQWSPGIVKEIML